MTFNFTDDQRMALEFPGNVIISAGAGSGKTRVLVEKYFRLLVDQHPEWPVDSVVAITFTRKAAAELKSRIIGRVLMELEAEREDTPRRARLLELRSEVGAAPIGTIHTFCGRLLREFAFDANLDPDYVVVEGAQEGALRLSAARTAIAEATAAKGQDIYNDLLALLNLFSASRLTEILAGMLAGRTTYIAPAKRYVSSSVGDLFEDLLKFHKEYADEIRQEIGREWKNLFRALVDRSNPGKVYDVVIAAAHSWPNDYVNGWNTCSEILEGVFDALFTKTGACRKREFKQAGFNESDSICSQAEVLLEKHKSACLEDPDENDRADIDLSRKLARLFLWAVRVYEQQRGGEGDEGESQLMDFADLEIFAERLIRSSAELRRQIRERYPYLIIDEFQDTSQAQWNILKPVVTNEDGQLRKNSLFVVGDRKQGVYGFRDANVALFSEVQAAVTSSNDEWQGNSGFVTMAANFRTNPGPLSFINNVFESLLSEVSSSYSVVFDPLKPMRTEQEGCVEFLLSSTLENSEAPAEDEHKLSAAEHRVNEAGLVAAHVKSLIDSGEAQPGDIALLFRKKSVFAEYEGALKKLGIPCVTQHGENLFHQPELADLVAALNSVVYPHRDLVFVHYLRSPFVGCSDDLLLKIARTHGRSFWDKANTVLSNASYLIDQVEHLLEPLETDRLRFAVSVLRRARELVGIVPPYHVLKFIVDELGARHTVMCGYRGTQAASNIDKLLLIARSAETLSFEAFLEFIKSEEESLKGTSEAVDLTASDAVRIMTIHAAKGLEFPVVYLPDLNSCTSGRGHNVYGDGDQWMTLVASRDYASKPSFLTEYFRLISRKQQAAEERRVFYVAMTRCENRLVLCASPDAKPRGETFFQWITSEFQNGRRDGTLKLRSHFAETIGLELEGCQEEVRRSSGAREASLINALTFTNGFVLSSSRPDAFFGAFESDMVLQELSSFLSIVWNQDLGAGHKFLEQRLEFLPSVIRAQWVDQLVKIGERLLEEFEGEKAVNFGQLFRLISKSAILTFAPHISTATRCVWVALPGNQAKCEAEMRLYQDAVAAIPGAPDAFVWNLAIEMQPVEG